MSATTELQLRVNQLYRSPPGSAEQRDANEWLLRYMGSDEAWSAVLEVFGNGTATHDGGNHDEALDFLAAKIMQMKIQRHWENAPAVIRQRAHDILCMHLRMLALGSNNKSALVNKQLVLAFVHLSLRHLCTHHEGGGFVAQLGQVLGITEPLDMRGQCRGVMLLLEIMQCLPPELVRIDVEHAEFSVLSSGLQAEAPVLVRLLRAGLEATMDPATGAIAHDPVSRELRRASLCCLLSWCVAEEEGVPPLVPLVELRASGLLGLLLRLADVTGNGDGAGVTRALQVLVEAVRVPSRDGGVLERLCLEEPESGEEAAAQAGALGHVAGFCAQLCPALLQRTECVAAVAGGEEGVVCEELRLGVELVCLLLEHHAHMLAATRFYPPLLQQHGLDGPGLLEGLWGCLLSFTAHRDVEGVASSTLELWFFAPRLLGRHPCPACLHHLSSLLPPLLSLLLDQCTPSEALCGDLDWATRLGGGGGGGEESEALEALLAFRREACDTIQAIVSGWPQGRQAREFFLSALSNPSGPGAGRRMEAALWGLTAVAMASAESWADEEEEEEEEEGEGEGEEERGVWVSVLCALPTLEPWPALVLVSGCRLVEELCPVLRHGPLGTLEGILGFLTRRLAVLCTCGPAARALRSVASRAFRGRRDMGPNSSEEGGRMVQALLSAMLDPQTTHTLAVSAEACAHAAEGVSLLCGKVLGPASVDPLCQVLHTLASALSSARGPQSVGASLALGRLLRGVLCGLGGDERDVAGRGVVDGVLGRVWGPIVQAGVLDVARQGRGAAAVEGSCLTLAAVMGATQDLPRLLPVVMAWLLPFLLQPQATGPIRPPAALLWAPPLRVLGRVLARGAEEEHVGDEATWTQVTQVYDTLLDGARGVLASAALPPTPAQQAYNPAYFLEAFTMLRTMACGWLNGRGRRAVSGMATDPWGVARGLHIATLGLELPIQEVEVVRALCGFLTVALKLPDLTLGPDVIVRLLRACLLASAGRVSSQCLRPLADCLHLALHDQPTHSGLFQASLTFLTTTEAAHGGLRGHVDMVVLDWVGRTLIALSQRAAFAKALKLYYEVCAGLRPVGALESSTFRA